MDYDADGNLVSILNPALRTLSFEYDAGGRVTKQVLPDPREIQFTYDANANLTSVTPPGRPAHQFTYPAGYQEQTYNPLPGLGHGIMMRKWGAGQPKIRAGLEEKIRICMGMCSVTRSIEWTQRDALV